MSSRDACTTVVFEVIGPGDLLPIWQADSRADGIPIDWTGWELTFDMRGPVIITGSVVGSTTGVLTYTWVTGDTDVPGDYEVTIHGLSPEGKPQTFTVPGIVRIGAP